MKARFLVTKISLLSFPHQSSRSPTTLLSSFLPHTYSTSQIRSTTSHNILQTATFFKCCCTWCKDIHLDYHCTQQVIGGCKHVRITTLDAVHKAPVLGDTLPWSLMPSTTAMGSTHDSLKATLILIVCQFLHAIKPLRLLQAL